jgi:hypothetical protein
VFGITIIFIDTVPVILFLPHSLRVVQMGEERGNFEICNIQNTRSNIIISVDRQKESVGLSVVIMTTIIIIIIVIIVVASLIFDIIC